MSAFELKRVAADGADLSEVDASVSKTEARGFGEIADALALRFADLVLANNREDTAFYIGRDLTAYDSQQQVEIKVLTGDPSSQLQLFRLESRAASKLLHPNIVQSREVDELEGVYYSVGEHVPVVLTLEDVLKQEGWLDVYQAIGILRPIADALAHAHQLGVLHLRIHPGNILIGGNGVTFLSDFGIEARPELDWAQRRRAAKCPVHYISPEHINGKSLDFRSDLYSLGVVFYRMLTDRLPIDSEDCDAVRQKHLTRTPLAAHLYNADIPQEISSVINRLLEKDPNDRFQEFSSFCAELDKFGNRPIDNVTIQEDPQKNVLKRADEMESADSAGSADEADSADQLKSADQMKTVDDYGPDPIDLNNLTSNERRGVWESPSITVIEAPVEQWSGSAALNDQTVVEGIKLSLPDAREERFTYPLLASHAHGHASTTQLKPIVMVVILAAAVITGIIVLARADRFGSINQSPLDSNGDTQRRGEIQRPALPPQSSKPESASVPGSQPSGNQPDGSTNPGSNIPAPAGRALRRSTRSVQTPATTRRRKPRRRWRRSTQYFSEKYRSHKLLSGRTTDVHGVLRPKRDSVWINA